MGVPDVDEVACAYGHTRQDVWRYPTVQGVHDGTILARRLHGDEIEKKLNEIFQ